jgi:hypothetical protein
MILNETNITLIADQTLVTIPFTYTVGNNELWVWLNHSLIYLGRHYVETGATSIQLLFAGEAGDVLTVGIVRGGVGVGMYASRALYAPSLGIATDYPGIVDVALPTDPDDDRVTHVRVYRRRNDVLSIVATPVIGTTTLRMLDAEILDEYFITYVNVTNNLEGEASPLVRIHPLADWAPPLA